MNTLRQHVVNVQYLSDSDLESASNTKLKQREW